MACIPRATATGSWRRSSRRCSRDLPSEPRQPGARASFAEDPLFELLTTLLERVTRVAPGLEDPATRGLIGVALVVGLLAGMAVARGAGRRRIRRRFRRGRLAEAGAESALRALGFRVLATQVEADAHVLVDGCLVQVPVRADFLVRRWGRRALVEVKSGEEPRAPEETDTRRQLLEYALVFPDLPLYHLDATSGVLSRIRFAHRRPGRLGWLATGVVVGAAMAAAVLLGWPRIP